MLKRLVTLLIIVPVGIVIIALAVANRQQVSIRLPLEIGGQPMELFSLPLFFLLFAMLITGMMIGGFATWFKQGHYRRLARDRKVESTKLGFEAEKQKNRAEELQKANDNAHATGSDADEFPLLAGSSR